MLIGTQHDIVSELAEWEDAPDGELVSNIISRAARVVRWLAEDIVQMDDRVRMLQSASEEDSAHIPARVMVAESATNTPEAFGRVKSAAGSLHIETRHWKLK